MFNASSAPPSLKKRSFQAGTALGTSSGTSPTVLYGAGVDTFSNTNTITSTTTLTLTPGQTLSWIYFAFANPGGMTEQVLGCNTPPLTTGKGWRIVNQFNGVYLGYAGGNFVDFIGGTSLPLGLHRFVMVWRASDNHLLVSHNGGTLTDKGLMNTGTAPDGTSKTNIGAKLGDTTYNNLVSGSVCAWSVINSELNATQAQNLSAIPLTTSRFSFIGSPGYSGFSPTFDFDANRDWNGSASTIISQGSSPITFAVGGTPTLSNYSEVRIPTTSAMYFDSKIVDVQSGYTLRECYANLKLSGLNHRNVGYEWFNNFQGVATQSGIGCWLNGSYSQINYTTYNTSGVSDFIVTPNSNASAILFEGNQINYGGNTGPVTGVFINAIRKPVGAAQIKPTTVQKRLVILGDSIMSGFYPSNPFQTSVSMKLKTDFPTSGTGGVTMHGWGGCSLYQIGSDASSRSTLASLLASELNGTGSNWLWIQIGTNDYGASFWSAASFGTAYADLLDKIHAASPGTTIYCQTPFQRIAPSSEAANGQGNTLGDYRTQITNAATARPGYCVAVDGTTIYSNPTIYNAGSNPTGCYYTDGLHNVDNGTTDIKTFIKTTIGY